MSDKKRTLAEIDLCLEDVKGMLSKLTELDDDE